MASGLYKVPRMSEELRKQILEKLLEAVGGDASALLDVGIDIAYVSKHRGEIQVLVPSLYGSNGNGFGNRFRMRSFYGKTADDLNYKKIAEACLERKRVKHNCERLENNAIQRQREGRTDLLELWAEAGLSGPVLGIKPADDGGFYQFEFGVKRERALQVLEFLKSIQVVQ